MELQAGEDGTLTEILVPGGRFRRGGSAHCAASAGIRRSPSAAAPRARSAICSPLAARLAAEAAEPRHAARHRPPGQIMAADVRAALRPADGPARRVPPAGAPGHARHATRVDNFYLYSLEANMAYLAAISTPIAVQCEKLIGGRYSLFDYVVRAAVKACASEPEWLAGDAAAELLDGAGQGRKIRLH